MSQTFAECSSLQYLPDISKWNTYNVTNMKEMFSGCVSLKSIPDISKWDTSKVTDISFIFFDCRSLIQIPNISKWNISNLNYLKGLFKECKSATFIPNLSKWKNNEKIKGLIEEEFSINKTKKLILCNKLNTENIIRNDELKFLPQIEICFDKIEPFDLKEYTLFRKEIKKTLNEEDFSIIEI